MPHNFSEIPPGKRVLIDTNVLLSAVLIEDGIARRAIQSLQALDRTVHCDEVSYLEAVRRLARARQKLCLAIDPNDIFEALVRELGVLFLPPGDPTVPSGIHRHDRHIPRAANDYAAWVMTDDVELQIALTRADYQARNSFEVLQAASELNVAAAVSPPLPPRVAQAWAPPKAWIMAWVTPLGWPVGVPTGDHTIIDVPGLVRILYDTVGRVWRATYTVGKTLSVSIELAADQPTAVATGYDCASTPTRLFIAAGDPTRPPTYNMAKTPAKLPVLDCAGASLGHSLSGRDHWNGYIRRVSTGDRFISKGLWKQLSSVQDITPHPELDTLDKALVALNRFRPPCPTAARMLEL